MSVWYSFEWAPWVVAYCDACGAFTSSVHENDADVLFAEGDEHERLQHTGDTALGKDTAGLG